MTHRPMADGNLVSMPGLLSLCPEEHPGRLSSPATIASGSGAHPDCDLVLAPESWLAAFECKWLQARCQFGITVKPTETRNRVALSFMPSTQLRRSSYQPSHKALLHLLEVLRSGHNVRSRFSQSPPFISAL